MLFNINRIRKTAVDVISSVFDGNGAASFKMRNHSYGFAAVAAKRKKERVEFIVIGFDSVDDIFNAFFCVFKAHHFTTLLNNLQLAVANHFP